MADYKHDHPGQKEPRAHGETHHENRIVDLNTASAEELADLPMVGPKRARDLMQHRPFKSWDDVQRRITYLLRRALGDLFLGPYMRQRPEHS